jgi:outer membrane protein assembly factor BamD (BamD/ComL family)
MIVFLNFSPNEVRDRDYFFQSGYHAYALWIGLGVAWVIGWIRDSFGPGSAQTYATAATAAVLACQPLLLLGNLWYTHDRRGNFVARDYAYNMLAPLKPNAFVFTNGDNDTFPLWYIQEVEGFRKDVRVVNLSLLNTDWYIQQLRDEQPRVPIQLDDASVKALGMGFFQDPTTGRVTYTNEYMVHHIMKQDESGSGWAKPPYFAVTVPEDFGFRRQFTLEGLVYRVNRDTLQPQIDVEATQSAMYKVFKYRGLFHPDGSWDSTVYKDENASTLSRNYAAAHIQLALWFHRRGETRKAITELERVQRMFPDYTDMIVTLGQFYLESGDTTRAIDLLQRLVARAPESPEARYYYGVALVYRKRVDEALRQFDAALRLDPNYGQAYYACYYTLWEAGQREQALTYLERWVSTHPEDAQAREMVNTQRRALGEPSSQPVLPRPPAPSLP